MDKHLMMMMNEFKNIFNFNLIKIFSIKITFETNKQKLKLQLLYIDKVFPLKYWFTLVRKLQLKNVKY